MTTCRSDCNAMWFAITREISGAFQNCQLTHLPRVAIDLERARAQHDAYEWALVELGCTVRRVDSGADMPDSVFVEDVAVVFPQGAVIARSGAESRRIETPPSPTRWHGSACHTGRFRSPARSTAATSSWSAVMYSSARRRRTNAAGINQLRQILTRLGYSVRAVPVQDCLH